MSKVLVRIGNLKRFFVFYRKPEYLRHIKRRVDVRPEDIPAIEVSDDKRLCKNPLVSVTIMTFNQEKFIREALDSALMQKTDFEYEVIVGDDCSSDSTGAICAEYQKRFPDKVRFITANVNVRNLGGNGVRVRYRARGKYIAPLEGDDYWTDPEKLQKQVEIFRKYSEVTLCMAGRETLSLDGRTCYAHNEHFDKLLSESPDPDGTLFDGDDYFAHPLGGPIGTVMYRTADLDFDDLAMFYFRTSFTYYFLLLKRGKGFLLKKPMVMYRVNPNGVWSGKTPLEQAKFSYEYFGQLLLHSPENRAIKSMQKFWWHRFKLYLFPWRLIYAVGRSMKWPCVLLLGFCLALGLQFINVFPSVRTKVDMAHSIIASRYLSNDGLMYAYIGELPNKDDCERGVPNALGYWTPIENTPMFTGSYLSAMVSRSEKVGDYKSANECRRLAEGLVKIASVSDIPGMIVRGFGKDGISHYSSSTTCQYIPWFLGLHSYATSRVCPLSFKMDIKRKMTEVAEALLKYNWRCPCDGPLKGCYFGAINSKGLPHRDSAHYLFVLLAMYDTTGDVLWLKRYNAAKEEVCEKSGCTRLESCARGWELDKGFYNPEADGNMWIYVCTQECLAELFRLDKEALARDCYLRGMIANAEHARRHMALAKRYDNDRGGEFKYANWRQGYVWSVQTNITHALEVSRTGKRDVLGDRKWYERKYVSQPLCAAAICAYAGMYKDEVMETIRVYDYDKINISEFFFGEIAYWKFSERNAE